MTSDMRRFEISTKASEAVHNTTPGGNLAHGRNWDSG